jgi:hypothetical protein
MSCLRGFGGDGVIAHYHLACFNQRSHGLTLEHDEEAQVAPTTSIFFSNDFLKVSIFPPKGCHHLIFRVFLMNLNFS